MHSNMIAVDIVLIPPDEVVQFAIGLNRTFPRTAAEHYILDAKTCIPHITLLMGLITKEQLPEVRKKLDMIAQRFSPLALTITHGENSTRADGKTISGLQIKKTPELQKLHETILDEMSSIFSYDGVKKEMFYNPPPIDRIPMFWVQGFAKTAVRENYKPHITLGVGALKQEVTPIQFTASKLALCHLGNYCTCRDVVWSGNLL